MSTTTKVRGEKGSRQAVELFGATDEAALELLGSSLDGTTEVHAFDVCFKASALRPTLRYAVQRQIFCPANGRSLDMTTVVLVTVTGEDGEHVGTLALSPLGWDEVGADLVRRMTEQRAAVKVLTERHLRAAERKAGVK
jgi:hypothetical protein